MWILGVCLLTLIRIVLFCGHGRALVEITTIEVLNSALDTGIQYKTMSCHQTGVEVDLCTTLLHF